MNGPRDVRRHMIENGFTVSREAKTGTIWTDGVSTVLAGHSVHCSHRNVKNLMADVKRAIAMRPPQKEEKDSDMTSFKLQDVARHIPIKKPDPQPAETEKRKTSRTFKRYELLTREALYKRIIELWSMKVRNETDILAKLRADGFKSPDDSQPIRFRDIPSLLAQLRARGYCTVDGPSESPAVRIPPPVSLPAPRAVVAKEEAAASAPVSKQVNKLPSFALSILTDPELSDKKKIQMLMAYASEE